MPAHALALNENLGGAVGSKTTESVITRGDNEDTPPPLCNPEPSGIQSPPREAIPQGDHLTDEPFEVASVIGREKPWDVFQHEPPRSSSFHNVKESKSETGSCSIGESPSRTGGGEVLAREPPGIDFGIWYLLIVDLRDVPEVGNAWESFGENGRGVRIDLT
jgi:hypothetical protein